MTSVTVAMLGARMHYAVPRILHEADMLERLYTDSYIGNKPWLESILGAIPDKIRPGSVKRWLGRKESAIPNSKVFSSEYLGIWYANAHAAAESHAQRERIYIEASRRLAKHVARHGFGSSTVLWAFDSSAKDVFALAKKNYLTCVLEQAILPRKLKFELLAEEYQRWSGWESEGLMPTDEQGMIKREADEWGLADQIVVGSNFVRQGLMDCGVDSNKISVIPYGIAMPATCVDMTVNHNHQGKLRVLFLGEVGLRKGIPYLLQALEMMGPDCVEARIAGNIRLARSKLQRYAKVATFLGAVPRIEVSKLFEWADVFVLPSIVEGSATVTYEALLQGVPVVTTENAGSLVMNGHDGYIVAARDPVAIYHALMGYYSERELLVVHRKNALNTRGKAGLDRYSKDLVSMLRHLG